MAASSGGRPGSGAALLHGSIAADSRQGKGEQYNDEQCISRQRKL